MTESLLLAKPRSADAAAIRARVKTYDFRRPDKFSLEQIRSVQNIHETFARLTTTTLSASMRALVHVHVSSVDQMTYEEFIRSIPSPTTIAIFGMDPLRGQAVLEIDPSIVFAIVERLFGGSAGGGGGAALKRELTDIEHSVMEGIIMRMLGNLRESWTPILDIGPRLSQIETNPMFAQIVPPSEMIMLVSLETRIGEVEGIMNLCFPYLTIEPIIPQLSAQFWYNSARRGVDAEAPTAMMSHIEGLDIDVEVFTAGESLTLRELGALKKGSLLRLPGYDRGDVTFRMGEREIFRMRSLPRMIGQRREYEVLEELIDEKLEVAPPAASPVEAVALESALRRALADFRSSVGDRLSEIASSVSELGLRQDELRDQLALAPPEAEGLGVKSHERRRPFDFLNRADPDQVLNFVVSEHPQALALVLSFVEPQLASALFGKLPQELQPNVAKRIATMGSTTPEVVREVERVLKKKLETLSSEAYAEAGGIASVVDILSLSDRSTEKQVVEALEGSDSELAEEIKKRLFVFEDLVVLEPGAVAKLVERMEAEVFLRALAAASDTLKSFVWGCLPEHSAAALRSRLEKIGQLRLREVEAAQAKVVTKIREMEESGEIVIEHP